MRIFSLQLRVFDFIGKYPGIKSIGFKGVSLECIILNCVLKPVVSRKMEEK